MNGHDLERRLQHRNEQIRDWSINAARNRLYAAPSAPNYLKSAWKWIAQGLRFFASRRRVHPPIQESEGAP